MTHNPAMPHGTLREVFPDVFFVMGTMRNEFFGAMWQFSRNMTVVRQDGGLTLFNAVRLDDAGLAALEALGEVRNVVQIGALHGHDDRFYVDRYGATMWAVKGMPQEDGLTVDRWLEAGGELPVRGAKLFLFEETKLPEAIIVLDRDGGIAIACDALQNWVEPDEFMDDATAERMKGFGFFTPANLGPVWVQTNEPRPGDFERLKGIPFQHALCGHGVPLVSGADSAFHATFERFLGA
ncbi:MAG: hypothetical protein KC656_20560 [Myxococcales bacterium]|nr:hypothetical protein [Myxococcales bacterium]